MTPEQRARVVESLNESTRNAHIVWCAVVDRFSGPLVHALVWSDRGIVPSGASTAPDYAIHSHDIALVSQLGTMPGRFCEVIDDPWEPQSLIAGIDVAGHLADALHAHLPQTEIAAIVNAAVIDDSSRVRAHGNGVGSRLLTREIILAHHLARGGRLPNATEWKQIAQDRRCAGDLADLEQFPNRVPPPQVLEAQIARLRERPQGPPRFPLRPIEVALEQVKQDYSIHFRDRPRQPGQASAIAPATLVRPAPVAAPAPIPVTEPAVRPPIVAAEPVGVAPRQPAPDAAPIPNTRSKKKKKAEVNEEDSTAFDFRL